MYNVLKIFFTLLFLCSNCFGQNESNDKRIEDELVNLVLQTRNKMNEDNIKDYFILSHSYYSELGTDYIDDKGKTLKTERKTVNDFKAYIFWKNNDKCFAKYIERNKSHQTVELNNCDFMKINQNLIDKISKEKILPVVQIYEGKKSFIDQPIHYKTRFYFAKSQSSIFPNFYLDYNKENLNYCKNNKLATTKLYQVCQKIIKEKSTELYE